MILLSGHYSTRVAYINFNAIMCEIIFGYRKYDSVTQALFETRVLSFETVLHNALCVSF